MTEAVKKRGNPNLKPTWTKPADKVMRVPEYLADTLMGLARQVDSGKIKQSQLNQLCLNPDAIAQELFAITGKHPLTVVPDTKPTNTQLLEKLEEFEEENRKAWGSLPQHRGEFSTDSARWAKYHEFKDWLARQ